ncbi:DUF1570 domain-containing protein [Candidatus Cloacimonadota bacterium]
MKIPLYIVLFIGITLMFSGCEKLPTETTIEFEEINCKLTEEERSIVTKIADFEFDFYHSIFHEKYPKLKVKLFGDSLEYQEYQREISKSKARNGFYSQSKKIAVINKNEKFMKTIYHELNHFIIHYYIMDVPQWINEGLSEYFETAALENGFVKIRPQNPKVERLKKWTSEKNKIDLEDFFSWTNSKWRKKDSKPDHYSYTLSWGVVHFFMEDELRKDIFKQIITAIKKGRNSTQAINKFYPGGVEQFQYDFVIYVDLKL